MSDLLEKAARLSRYFGSVAYVVGGGGNSSVKDAGTVWVKPSGSCLSALEADRFVALDRRKLLCLDEIPADAGAAPREALAKDLLTAAIRPGSSGRPSVEAPLHNLFAATYVVHTHPPLINGLLCSVDGRQVAACLFPEALWMDLVDPGITLYNEAKKQIANCRAVHGHDPQVVLIKNHGVFVTGEAPEQIIAVYGAMLQRLREAYLAAGIATELIRREARQDGEEMNLIKAALPPSETQAIIAAAPFAAASGPPTPDHIVYMKSFPHAGELTGKSLAAFRQANGYYPKIMVTRQAAYAVGTSSKEAGLALEMALDAALIKQLAQAFGGIEYMPPAARHFIENWEAEAYRRQQV